MSLPANAKVKHDVDKSAWGAGPWMDEPDHAQWTDAETGLPCMVVRHQENGHLCGYVGVPTGHPSHGKDYDAEHGASVHWGLTFANKCDPEGRICHVPEPGEPDDIWWLGFDCAHAYDYSPGRAHRVPADSRHLFAKSPDETYRDITFVQRECESLAKQLKAMT